jgi:hypothetical protein
MDPFRRLAEFTTLRDSAFVALAAATLMTAFSFNPLLALKIGTAIALIHAMVMILRAERLTEQTVARSEPWRALGLTAKPDHGALRAAHATLRETMLRNAQIAAGIAIALDVPALAGSLLA